MEFKFVPEKLIKSKENIIQKHSKVAEPKDIELNDDFIKIIKRLIGLNKEELYLESLVLTNRELMRIVQYLPHNFFHIKLDNLFKIVLLRINSQLCWELFHEWQNSFDNEECNNFMIYLISEKQDFDEIIKTCHFTKDKFIEILKSNEIPVLYGKQAIFLEGNGIELFHNNLLYLGVRENSKLEKQCAYLFFTFCSERDYLITDEKKLIDVLTKYDEGLKKKFLLNFLTELSFVDLKNFQGVAEIFLNITGENHSKRFYQYFKGCAATLIRKYVDWINTYKIHKIFGCDERSAFWECYHQENIIKHSYSNSVVMDFGKYVAIEFLGQAMGPCYIYKKEYFDEKIKESFALKLYDNFSLRQYLYRRRDYDNGEKKFRNKNVIRLVHNPNPGWQSTFNDVLINNKITEFVG